MKKKDLKTSLQRFKGQTVNNALINKLTQHIQDELLQYLYDTSFEIWNAGCTDRLNCSYSGDKDWKVCDYDNPLSAKKEFATLDAALNYMEKQDES